MAWVVIVHNFKDDPYAEQATVHGPFADNPTADIFLRAVIFESSMSDCYSARITELLPGTVEAATPQWTRTVSS